MKEFSTLGFVQPQHLLFFLLAAQAVQELLSESSDEDEPEPACSLE